jgi:hypothetical protein
VPVPLFYVVYLVYLAVDRIVAGAEPVQGLYSLALAGLACVLGRSALFALSLWVSHLAAYDILHQLRLDVAEHVAGVPLGYFTVRCGPARAPGASMSPVATGIRVGAVCRPRGGSPARRSASSRSASPCTSSRFWNERERATRWTIASPPGAG